MTLSITTNGKGAVIIVCSSPANASIRGSVSRVTIEEEYPPLEARRLSVALAEMARLAESESLRRSQTVEGKL